MLIFDSPEMLELRKIYEKKPDYLVPRIVYLDKSQRLEGERAYLEGILATVSQKKQRDWLSRLISKDHKQHLGAWFEMMLVGWCRDIGHLDIEPHIVGDFPDLSILVGEQKIVLEAKALLKAEEEQHEEILSSGIKWALSQIRRPYVVEIISINSSQDPDWHDIIDKAEEWLETNPEEKFLYNDCHTVIELQTVKFTDTQLKKVQVIESRIETKRVNPDPIKQPLHKKAGQHKAIRSASYPYIIALYLESSFLSPEEVVEAWFGSETLVIDLDKHQIVESYLDKSGIHYIGSQIRHTTVSGTLVFKSTWSKEDKRHFLEGWYIQNPYAKVAIDARIFPVIASFVVKEQSLNAFIMSWE